MMSAPVRPEETLVATGIEGLDPILTGGLPPYFLPLVEGGPGAGKTTIRR
jgi:circadian clock protein KaiC